MSLKTINMDSSSKNIKENKEMESREVNPEHHHHPDHPDHFSISEIPREIIHGIQKVVVSYVFIFNYIILKNIFFFSYESSFLN